MYWHEYTEWVTEIIQFNIHLLFYIDQVFVFIF